MSERRTRYLVSTDWLAGHLGAPDLVLLDASWHLPPTGRDGYREYLDGHIPGALFFDIDEIADTDSGLPHMLPPAEKFSSRVRKMGIGDGKRVIAYDSLGLFSAARVWWMFRVMGHDDVAILDGGLAKWIAEGRPLEEGVPAPRSERHFTARIKTMMVRDKDDLVAASRRGDTQILDARSPGRFAGREPEPREGLRSGHIPGSLNLPYASLLNGDGTLKDDVELRRAFEAAGVDLSRPVVTTCGSGVTAAILSLGLELLGHRKVSLYDGSWSEWGADETLPVDSGE